jgi:protein-L-isoaspartate O-methyltransferase
LTDFGETAEAVLRDRLKAAKYDCVLVGAGVRTVPTQFILFEKLINIIHEHAPTARICFNTKPGDTAEAVRRWI